jgi:hypothetical protein
LKTWIRDVMTTINRGMLVHTCGELEIWLDVSHATQSAHIEVQWVYKKLYYVCIKYN